MKVCYLMWGFAVYFVTNLSEAKRLGKSRRIVSDEAPEYSICSTAPTISRGEANTCENTPVGSTCSPCCEVAYQTEIQPICVGTDQWEPTAVTCEVQSQCFTNLTYRWNSREGMPMIKVVDCTGELYFGSTFDLEVGLPFYTVYTFTNRNLGNGGTTGNWRSFPCTQGDLDTRQFTNYSLITNVQPSPRVGFDRGHLANNADIRFSRDAVISTYQFINAVPQDSYANQQPWRIRELLVRELFSENFVEGEIRGGIVITGAFRNHYLFNSVWIPKCIWKLACTKITEQEWTVAGFYHQNILTYNHTDRDNRNEEAGQIRDQAFLGELDIPIDPQALWDEVMYYFPNETQDNILKCKTANPIIPPEENQPGNYLYEFWNKSNGKDIFDREMIKLQN